MDDKLLDSQADQPPAANEGDQIQLGDIQHSKAVAIGRGATAVYQGLSVQEVAALVVELKRKDQPKVWDGRIPYLGLAAFQESDAPFFFGRETLVDDLLERVQQASFITIAGPSGSGKSSVARAGLFHALRAGAIETSDRWLLATMQPKDDPLGQLALALERATQSTAVGDALHPRNQPAPDLLLRHIQIHLSDDKRERCVLLVDQFEEIFTQTRDTAVQAAFINLLTEATQTADSRFIVVLSLRSEFVSQCAHFPDLRKLMSRQFQLVGAMEPHDLAKAVTLPALEVGVGIDPALVSRIVTDMKGEPGALPLMSFALRDLFEAEKTKKGEPMSLTLAEYLQRGGIESALERHANNVFAAFSDEQKALASNIFSKLVEVGQGRVDTRRTATLQELIPAGANAQAVIAVIAILAEARLITTDEMNRDVEISHETNVQTTVTLAHEKLIDAWPWLRQLVDDNRELIALQNQINSDARAWAQGEDAGFLYRGGRLLQVEEKLPLLQPNLAALSHHFIQSSLQAEKQRQRNRRVLQVGGAVLLVILIMLGIGAILINNERNDAIEARETAVAAQATSALNAAEANFQAMEADIARGTAEAAATTESEARSLAVVAQSTAQADATRANFAEATAVAAQDQTEQQRQIMSLIAQSQALMNVRAPSNEAVAQARLMAVVAAQIDREATGGQNSSLLTQWNHHLTRAVISPYQPLTTLTGHTDLVYQVAWNVDGTRLASVSCKERDNHCIQGELIIWDTESWQPLTTLSGHADLVIDVAWNADGTRLASASYDGTVIIWQAYENQPDSWQQLTALTDHTSNVFSVAWNADGTRLASASCGERDSRDSCIQGELIIWDTESWQPLTTLSGHAGHVGHVAWNASGTQLASASIDGTVIIWQAEENQPDHWQQLTTLTDHMSVVNRVAWNADGTQLASASNDNTVIIWDTASWQPLTTLTDHTDVVLHVTWSGNGSRLASASAFPDNKIIIWDTDNWQPLTTLSSHTEINGVAWNTNGTRLASSSCGDGDGFRCLQGEIIIWDTESWQPLTTLPSNTDIYGVAWNSDASRLASASCSEREELRCLQGEIIIWDTASWQPLTTLTGHRSTVYSVAWNADDTRLASTSCGERDDLLCVQGEILIWDTASWQLLTTLTGHRTVVNSLTWNADGTHLVSISTDSIIIWQADENQPDRWQQLTTLTEHRAGIQSVAWNPRGTRLASSSLDNTVIIWDTGSWQPLTTLTRHTGTVNSVAWSADGSRLATASDDRSVIIWDTDSWQPLATLSDHTGLVNSVAWSADGSRLASASDDRSIIIWDTISWQPLATFSDHTDWVLSVAWNADGTHLASTSWDGTVIITHYEDPVARNCDLARRNFSWDEWQRIFPNEPYRVICPQWPVHPSVPPEQWPGS